MENKIASVSDDIFQLCCFVMISLFSFLPSVAAFCPGKHGILFKSFGIAEIVVLIICFVLYLIYFALRTAKIGFGQAFLSVKSAVCGFFSCHKEAIFLMVVYILAALSAIFVSGTKRSLWGTDFRPDGLFMYTVFAALYCFSLFLKNKALKKIIIGFYIGNFIFLGLIMLQQYYGILGSANADSCPQFAKGLSNLYERMGFRVGHFYKGETASFYNLNHMGYYIGICSVMCTSFIYRSRKILTMIFSVLLSAFSYWVLVVNNTFGCFIAVLLTILLFSIFLVFKMKMNIAKALIPIIVFTLVCIGVTVDPLKEGNSIVIDNFTKTTSDVAEITEAENKEEVDGGSGRWKLWMGTLDMIREKPVFGYGPDNLKEAYTARKLKLDRAHCEALEIAVSIGIPAAVLYLTAIVYAVFTVFKKRRFLGEEDTALAPLMAVCSYFISGLVGVFLFYTACHFFILLGIMKD